jgi:hypothetical protein
MDGRVNELEEVTHDAVELGADLVVERARPRSRNVDDLDDV